MRIRLYGDQALRDFVLFPTVPSQDSEWLIQSLPDFFDHDINAETTEELHKLLTDSLQCCLSYGLEASGGLSAYGFVAGVGPTSADDPKKNLLGTPWWTDGARVVLQLSTEPTKLEDIDILDWTVED